MSVKSEIWKPIIGYEDKYMISNFGRVKSLSTYENNQHSMQEKILKPIVYSNGYCVVSLRKKRFFVHRLVATHFLLPIKDKLQVNHIDGDKKNNRVDNLEWVNASENLKHAFKIGLKHSSNKQKQAMMLVNRNKRKKVSMLLNGVSLNIFNSITEAEHYLGVNRSHISDVCKGKRNKALGFEWKYVGECYEK